MGLELGLPKKSSGDNLSPSRSGDPDYRGDYAGETHYPERRRCHCAGGNRQSWASAGGLAVFRRASFDPECRRDGRRPYLWLSDRLAGGHQ